MKQIRMTTAVLLAIKSFGTNTFSIYDITKKIREDVNNGDYETVIFNDNIEHETIREHFFELKNVGLLDELYINYNPAGYTEFCSVNPMQPQPATVVQTAMASTNIPTDVQMKIYSYLKNNGPSSMKQIQSRLKGHPYTCKELYQFLDKINLIDKTSTVYTDSQKYTIAF